MGALTAAAAAAHAQIFYRERGKMWYDPVFKVLLDDGSGVWRRRHYRVRRERGRAAGRFAFTVIDNGVLSDERWTVVDVDDGLLWGVFYYVRFRPRSLRTSSAAALSD